jgi:hypothetical protein
MDVDGLRKELEEHLAKNPDPSAPSGFRDRFDSAVEQMAGNDGIPDSAWEAQLQRIRDEAEAAHQCLGDHIDLPDEEIRTKPAGAGDPPPVEQRLEDRDTIRPPAADSGGRIAAAEGQIGFLKRFGIPLGVAAIALAAAYFAFRS